MRDSFGRNVNYMRLSITDLCNLRCKYCMPEEGVCKKPHEKIISFEEIENVVKAAALLGINKFRLTGGEPLVRKGIVSLVEKLSAIDGVTELVMTTNGVLLEKLALPLKKAGLQRINISLDTFSSKKYAEITRGGKLDNVFAGIEAAISAGLTPIRINVVAMKGFNDDEFASFAKLTLNKPIDVRFIELMPIGSDKTDVPYSYISMQEITEELSTVGKLEPLDDKTGVAKYFKLQNSLGRIGFISPMSNHFCGDCNKVRLTADGKLKPCLHSDNEIDINEALKTKDIDIIKRTIESVILGKPEKHLLLNGASPIKREMNRIGG